MSLSQESWYEFRVMAVMDDLISESSNVVGVSSTGQFLYKNSTTNDTQKLKHLNKFSFYFFLLVTSVLPIRSLPPCRGG